MKFSMEASAIIAVLAITSASAASAQDGDPATSTQQLEEMYQLSCMNGHGNAAMCEQVRQQMNSYEQQNGTSAEASDLQAAADRGRELAQSYQTGTGGAGSAGGSCENGGQLMVIDGKTVCHHEAVSSRTPY